MRKWLGGAVALMVLLGGANVKAVRAQDVDEDTEDTVDTSATDSTDTGATFTVAQVDTQITPDLVTGTANPVIDDPDADPPPQITDADGNPGDAGPTGAKGDKPGNDSAADPTDILKKIPGGNPAPPTVGPFKPLGVATPGGISDLQKNVWQRTDPLNGALGGGSSTPTPPPPASKPWWKFW